MTGLPTMRFFVLSGAFLSITAAVYLHSAYAATPAATTTPSSLQSQINAQNQEVVVLNQEIAKYEAEIKQAGTDKKTLQAAINALNLQRSKIQAQVAVTQHQINATQLQIQQLGTKIVNTQQTVDANQAALGEDVRSLQETDNQPLLLQLFSSSSLAQVWSDADATLQIQSAIENKVLALHAQEAALADSQNASKQKQDALTTQKKVLASQQVSLTQTTRSKAQLLSETNAKESNYQRLLAAAKAELASFSTFAQNAGGSGLLANQTNCDAWGCYYNQRDAAWGNDSLNGTRYPLKSDGCLITSMAMVMTHYGYRNVTPVSINANPSNFAAYYPAYLLFTISVDGVTATRKAAVIDATLATGNPVVVGLYAYGGTHYVVLTSGSRGSYLMRDPYVPNGKDISFSSHYSLRNIFSIARVAVS